MAETTYTLEELAEAFDLTPRNARHWIEKILPPHHKKGRGSLARYGRDTFNCFAFVQRARAAKLTSQQIARVLSELAQDQVDRIAEGREELKVLDMLSAPLIEEPAGPPPSPAAASTRARRYADRHKPMQEAVSMLEVPSFLRAPEEPRQPRWKTLYDDGELQIRHRGEADEQQCEQVSKAAELIRSILRR